MTEHTSSGQSWPVRCWSICYRVALLWRLPSILAKATTRDRDRPQQPRVQAGKKEKGERRKMNGKKEMKIQKIERGGLMWKGGHQTSMQWPTSTSFTGTVVLCGAPMGAGVSGPRPTVAWSMSCIARGKGGKTEDGFGIGGTADCWSCCSTARRSALGRNINGARRGSAIHFVDFSV